MHMVFFLSRRRGLKPEGRKPEPDKPCPPVQNGSHLPLARLRRGEYHEVVLIGLVPALAFRAPGRSRRRDGFR